MMLWCCTAADEAKVVGKYDEDRNAHVAALVVSEYENDAKPPNLSLSMERRSELEPILGTEPETVGAYPWHRTRFGGEPFGEPEPGGLPSLLLEFMVDDSRHTAEITHKPLGISFDNCTPLTVTKVVANGTGAQAGIQVGWVIRRIGGMSLVGMDYDAVVELLLKGIERLPERLPHDYSKEPLCIEFHTNSPTAPLQVVRFSHKPLDFSFLHQVPIVVRHITPGGNAEQLGVQVGWTVKSFADVEVADMEYDMVIRRFKQATSLLPPATVDM
jgi:hypothetical protein